MADKTTPPFKPAWWLRNPHLQTLWPVFFRRRLRPQLRRERLELPDGDFVDLDWTLNASGPIVIILHGLEGSSRSHYARGMLTSLPQHGMRAVVMHFRGCSGEPNRLARAYHSGDTGDIDFLVRTLRAREPNTPLAAIGYSLGGNALLKWLGEAGAGALAHLLAAATVSAPLDLMAAGAALGQGPNRIYTRMFLSTLRRKSLDKLARYPGLFDRDRVLRARTLRQFDDVFTAPLHGYRDTDDYWTRASSGPGLISVRLPTLVLNAKNDPFLPGRHLPGARQVSPTVQLEQPMEGGHAGFVGGAFPGNLDWLPQRLLAFFGVHSAPAAVK